MYYHPTILPLNAVPVANTTVTARPSLSCDAEITVYARHLVFKNTVFSVYADHVADKNGNEIPQYLSVIPNCLLNDAIAGVAVLPICDGKVGLIQVFRHPLGQWSWEAIKGHIEPGEDAGHAAVRELFEEAGFSVTQEKAVDLGVVAPEPGVIKAHTQLFTVIVSGEVRYEVERELGHGEMVFFAPDEIDNLIRIDQIQDASTLAILLKSRLK